MAESERAPPDGVGDQPSVVRGELGSGRLAWSVCTSARREVVLPSERWRRGRRTNRHASR